MGRARRGRGEGTICQRADGLWLAAVSMGKDGNGNRIRKTVTGQTKGEVQEKLKALFHDAGKHVETLTLGDYLQRWLDTTAQSTVRATTWDRYEIVVRLHLKPILGHLALGKLEARHIEDLYAKMAEKKASVRNRQMAGTILYGALKAAVRKRMIPHNPVGDVPKPRAPKKEMQVLSKEQVDRFLAVARADRLYALYVLAIGTGMRLGEIAGLAPRDIDLDAQRISVQRALEEIRGAFQLREVKTAKARRLIDLPVFVVTALREHMKTVTGDRVFTNTLGGWLRRSDIHGRSLVPLLKRAGLPIIRFHDLRHTHATLLLLSGTHPKIVSERLGHASADITLNTYSHVLPTMQRQVAERLDEMFR